MAFTYLLVDCANGFLLRVGVGISISQLYKMALLAGMLLYLLWKNMGYFLVAFVLILYFLVPLIVKAIMSGDTQHVVANFGYNLKLILFPISFLFFSSIEDFELPKAKFFAAFIWMNLGLLAVNIILGVLGIGYSQYDGPEGGGIGGRGFFFAGNEVAGIFVLFGGMGWYLTRHWYSAYRFLFFISLLLLGVLNTSKSAILGIILVVALIELPALFKRRMSLLQFLGLLSLPLLAVAIVGGVYYGIRATGLIDRINFFYQRMDLLTFILSGRNEMVKGAMSFYFQAFTFLDYLFGVGNAEFLELMGRYHGIAHMVEIDFFDILYMNGFLGLTLVFGVFFLVSIRSFKGSFSCSPVLMINTILLLISFMAGHILNSAMLGISLGLINGLDSNSSER